MSIPAIQAQFAAVTSKLRPNDRGIIDLPMPNGQSERFLVEESPIMDIRFSRSFPTFKTFRVVSTADPTKTGRISITPHGMSATILSPNGTVHIRPLDLQNPTTHEVSIGKSSQDLLECATLDPPAGQHQGSPNSRTYGTAVRTYTLAIATTGEFHDANGGSVSAATAVVVNSVNGIQAIYERELSVKFLLLTPKIYTDPNSDPFNPGLNRTQTAASVIESNFSGQGYDIGHVFHDSNEGNAELGSGGIAGVGVVCSTTPYGSGYWRGGGWSSSSNNTTAGWISLATHEFGHMFNMTHTFNGTGGNCSSNISSSGAYEIGSGSTIMSYQGLCGSGQNVPSSGIADDYFHSFSLERAINYMNGRTCQSENSPNNTPPTVSANPCGASQSIPKNTPFKLTASGSDADGDQLYYCWEQYDEDGGGSPTQGYVGSTAGASTLAPLFRSHPPTTDPVRYFPSLDLVTDNDYSSSFEPLPSVARTLNFRITARDWKAGAGAIDWSDLAVTVSNHGPLTLTAPNGGGTLIAGNSTNVQWSTNGTQNLSATVNIRLSIDGGYTYPYLLLNSTSNDGSANVTIPLGVANTSSARMMVESADNDCVVFFDISNVDFSIQSTCHSQTSTICPVTPLTADAGDPSLDLDQEQFFGGSVSQVAWTIDNGNPLGPLANATEFGGQTCQTPWYQDEKYTVVDFTVQTAGDYTLSESSPSAFTVVSVFEANNYNPANPCSGTFLGSNATGALSAYSFVTVALNPCIKYKAVLWTANRQNESNGSLTFSGPGKVYLANLGPGTSYGYTYVAVNTSSEAVEEVHSNADFRSLPVGLYHIFGASYYVGSGPSPSPVDPNNWKGQTLSQILSSGDCVLFSSNSRQVQVNTSGPCPPTLTVNEVPIPSDVYHANNQITSTGTVGSGSNVMFMAGNNVELMPNFTANQSAVFEIRIQGCN